jgi:RES domain-containing protein
LTRVYRILRKPYSTKPFDGEGGYRFGARWSSPGVRVAYAAEHLSLAMLEYYVHLDPDQPPTDLVVVEADIPDNVPGVSIGLKQLPANWRQSPAPAALAAIGDQFVAGRRAAVLTVPSVLAPAESNWLINPRHPAFARIRVYPAKIFEYDLRFFQ